MKTVNHIMRVKDHSSCGSSPTIPYIILIASLFLIIMLSTALAGQSLNYAINSEGFTPMFSKKSSSLYGIIDSLGDTAIGNVGSANYGLTSGIEIPYSGIIMTPTPTPTVTATPTSSPTPSPPRASNYHQ